MLVLINDAFNPGKRVAVPVELVRWVTPERKAVVRLPNGNEIVRKFPRDTASDEAELLHEQNKAMFPEKPEIIKAQEVWTMPEGYNK